MTPEKRDAPRGRHDCRFFATNGRGDHEPALDQRPIDRLVVIESVSAMVFFPIHVDIGAATTDRRRRGRQPYQQAAENGFGCRGVIPLARNRGGADAGTGRCNGQSVQRCGSGFPGSGRPSIPPEWLVRVLLLPAFWSIRFERHLMDRLDFDLLRNRCDTGTAGESAGGSRRWSVGWKPFPVGENPGSGDAGGPGTASASPAPTTPSRGCRRPSRQTPRHDAEHRGSLLEHVQGRQSRQDGNQAFKYKEMVFSAAG